MERKNIEIWPKLHEFKRIRPVFWKIGNFSKFVVFVCACVGGGSEYIEVPGKRYKTLN